MRIAITIAILTLHGCSLVNTTKEFSGALADAGVDSGRIDGGRDDATLPDGGTDAGPMSDAGTDAGLDGGSECASDPNPMGEGTCMSTADCLTHCSTNWDVACFFGPFGGTAAEGVCIYRDCRLADIDITFEAAVCPMFGNCPNRFCGRDRSVVTCCPPPGCNSFCSY